MLVVCWAYLLPIVSGLLGLLTSWRTSGERESRARNLKIVSVFPRVSPNHTVGIAVPSAPGAHDVTYLIHNSLFQQNGPSARFIIVFLVVLRTWFLGTRGGLVMGKTTVV